MEHNPDQEPLFEIEIPIEVITDRFRLRYHGFDYELYPGNCGVIIISSDPEYNYVLQIDPESREMVNEPIFNEYLVQYLTGELRTLGGRTIVDLMGWKIKPLIQEEPDNIDRHQRIIHDTWDVRGEHFPPDLMSQS